MSRLSNRLAWIGGALAVIIVGVLMSRIDFPADQPGTVEGGAFNSVTAVTPPVPPVLAGPVTQYLTPVVGAEVDSAILEDEGAPFNLLEVRCLDVDSGTVVPNLHVGAQCRGENAASTTTDEEGIARFRLHLNQQYKVYARQMDGPATGDSAGNSNIYWGRAVVDMHGHMGEVLRVDFRVKRGVTVTGRALLPNGEPLAGCVVLCSSIVRNHRTLQAISRANGDFRFVGVLPEKCSFVINGVRGKYRSGRVEVEVTEDMPPIIVQAKPWTKKPPPQM